MPDSSTLPELLTAGEVADLLRVHRQTISRWAADGTLQPANTPGRTLRFLRESTRVLVPPPFDLCQIRHAVITALGESF